MTDKLKCKTQGKFTPDDTVPTFIRKTYEILEECRFPEIIDWNYEGLALVIKKPSDFCQKVLPLYFKHNNLTSFIRQLNMYNFHKRRTQDVDHIYCHELFQRGKKDLLKDIRRKNNEHSLTIQKSMEKLETIRNSSDSSNLFQENQLLKKLNKEAACKVSSFEKKLKDLSTQNQALISQIYTQNEREEILKHLLTSLMKHYKLSSNQLPFLMKSYPPTSNSHRQDRPDFIDQTKSSSSYLNVGDFLKMNEENSANTYTNFAKYIESSSTEVSSDEVNQSSSAQESVPQMRKPDYSNTTTGYKYINFESDYLRALATNDHNTELRPSGLPSGILFKRPLEFETVDRGTLEIARRELSDSFMGGNFMMRPDMRNMMVYEEDGPKLGYFKNLRREELDINTSIDLMNFN